MSNVSTALVVPAAIDFGTAPAPTVVARPVVLDWTEAEREDAEPRAGALTESKVRELLASSDNFVAFGIAVIYGNQTADERQRGTTRHSNGKGFTGADAGYGSYLGKWVTGRIPQGAPYFEFMGGKFRPLSGKHLRYGRKMLDKYVAQIVRTVNGGA